MLISRYSGMSCPVALVLQEPLDGRKKLWKFTSKFAFLTSFFCILFKMNSLSLFIPLCRKDKRISLTADQLENSKTHDDLWNAAQMQLVRTGKMHGFLR